MIVPNTVRRTFIAAVASALTGPIIFYIAISVRDGSLATPVLLLSWTHNYVCAVLAIVPAHVMKHLNKRVRRSRQLGSYQLVELIGKGGMGEVWKARHRMLARPAAVKIILADTIAGSDRQTAKVTLTRFEREAQATAALGSPHTIMVHDYGLARDGTFYYVMELLDGYTLQTLIERFGLIPSERAIQILLQVCHSLYDAHQSGLVHRDVKPANIFLCRKGQEHDFVKVLDFGLVKRIECSAEGEILTTKPGVPTGTPAFMAPEQARGKQDIDHRADIYSLGCVAYWLVTGQYVFPASNAMDMMLQHVGETPTAPSLRTDLEIPQALDEVILACLQKDPDKRPPDAKELSRRLQACECQMEWTEDKAWEWWRLHPVDASCGTECTDDSGT